MWKKVLVRQYYYTTNIFEIQQTPRPTAIHFMKPPNTMAKLWKTPDRGTVNLYKILV